jgi:hypothetical protein
VFSECKWGQKPVGREVIQTLINKTDKVLPDGATWQVHRAGGRLRTRFPIGCSLVG